MRLDEPELLVELASDLGAEVGGDLVALLGSTPLGRSRVNALMVLVPAS